MKILVYNVAAENGGALTVLGEFYNESKSDLLNEYIFVLSLPILDETENIKILNFTWIKNSWFHRLYFDHFVAPKLIKKYSADRIISLQNTLVPHTKIYQSLFVQNALPFTSYQVKILEDFKIWFYQKVIGYLIKKSIIRANHVIVQTNWMKESCIKLLNGDFDKVEVKKTKIDIEVKKYFEYNQERISTFFYPSSGVIFKNHQIVIDACCRLCKEGFNNYRVIFTLFGNENANIKKLFLYTKNNKLPIEFIGPLKREEVFEHYSKSILIFPSYIETVGLPLLEARMHKTPIIAADLSYSRDILNGYNDTRFFNPFDSAELSGEMAQFILNRKSNL